ncbi:hypothetical protein [Clostridium senegalense]|nr:hypothetical protein [Clostridium senegalense]
MSIFKCYIVAFRIITDVTNPDYRQVVEDYILMHSSIIKKVTK